MIFILNYDATHFSINGLILDKSFRARKYSADRIVLNSVFNSKELQEPVIFSEYDIDGIIYGTVEDAVNALNLVVYSGVGGAVTISDYTGAPISSDNPLNVSLDELNTNDIDWINSDFTGWTGDPKNLFDPVFDNLGIYNDSVDNPKSFTLKLFRPRQMRVFGIGATTGNYSNIKVSILGSAGAVRGILDLSDDDSKRQSSVYKQYQFEFVSLLVEFYTADRVDVTNALLKNGESNRKQDYTLKFGRNPDIDLGGNETIWGLGGLYIFTTIAQSYYISSSNAADTEIIMIETVGINAEGRYQLEMTEIALQGQTKVLIPTNFLCIASNRAENNNGSALLGNVYIYEDTPIVAGVPTDLSKVRSYIGIGREQTEQAVYTVPEFDQIGRQVAICELYKWDAGVINNKATSGRFDLFVSEKGKVSKVKGSLPASQNILAEQNYGDDTPLEIQPGSDVYINLSGVTVNDVEAKADFITKLVVL